MYSSSECMAGGTRPTQAGGGRFSLAHPTNERVGRVPPAIVPGPGMFL